ncbi:MAG: RNA polymerase sigma factor [Planctomycetota bacterium]
MTSTMVLDSSDAELLAETAAGDAAAFGALVERHRDALYRYTRAIAAGDRAEDAMQHAFVQAWRHAGTLEARASLRPWLFAVARRALAREFERSAQRPHCERSVEELGEAAGFAANDVDPQRVAIVAEQTAILHEALAALAVEDREVLTLRDLEQLSGEDTAQILGLSLAAQKSRLHRARLRLLAELRGRIRSDEVE